MFLYDLQQPQGRVGGYGNAAAIDRAGGQGGDSVTTLGTGIPLPPPASAAPVAAVAEEEMPVMQPRLGKASLVRQVSGGRSIGALPITIDFPTPAGVSYDFVKPFLGRAEATLSFRVLRTGSVMLLELALAAAALLGYGLLRRRAPQSGAGYAAVLLAVSVVALAAAPAAYASAFGAAALAMGACLAAELIRSAFLHIHATRTGS